MMSNDVPFFPCCIVPGMCDVVAKMRCRVIVLHSPSDFTSCLPAGLGQMINRSGLIRVTVMVPEVGTTKRRSCCLILSFQTNCLVVVRKDFQSGMIYHFDIRPRLILTSVL